MKSIPIKISLKKSIAYLAFKVLIGLMILGCSSTKKMDQKTNLLSSDQNNGNDGPSKQQTNKIFPTLLKLICGALIGGVNYE